MTASFTTPAVVIGGLILLRQLEGTGIPFVLIPRAPKDPSAYSRFYRGVGLTMEDLIGNEALFLDRLIELAKGYPEKPVLFFGDDWVLFFVTRHRSVLSEYFRFTMPEQRILEECSDKMAFAKLAQEYDLPVPKSLVESPSLDCAQIEEGIGYPCVFKPDSHLGWFESEAVKDAGDMPQKVLLAQNREECEHALSGIRKFTDKFVVQEFIRGGEEEIYSFHTFVGRDGKPVASYVGKKIRTYPSMGGESSYVGLIRDEEVTRLGLEVAEKLGIRGVMKIDFKKDVDSGRFFVLEINLRFTLWNHLGARAGINLAELVYRDLCDLPMEVPSDYKDDLRWLHLGRDFRSFVKDYRPSGQLTTWQWLSSLMHPKVYAMFEWRDPMPFLVKTFDYMKHSIGKLK